MQTLAVHAPTWLVQFPALVTREHRDTLQRELLGATRERMLREIAELLETITTVVRRLCVSIWRGSILHAMDFPGVLAICASLFPALGDPAVTSGLRICRVSAAWRTRRWDTMRVHWNTW